MGAFNQLMQQFGPTLSGFMTNPFGTQQFKLGQLLGTSQANNLNQTATRGLTNNMIGSGMAGGASNPAATEMLQNQARANTSNTANLGFLQPTQNALALQQGALNTAANFKPLQTGGTQTQSTGGLGTRLPQLIGAGLGAAGNIATGGLSGLFSSGAGMWGGAGNTGIAPSGSFTPWSTLGSQGASGWAGSGVPGGGGMFGAGSMNGPGAYGGLGGSMAPPPPPGS